MSAEIAELLYGWGTPLIFAVAFLSCLAVPVPASLLFMAAGSFAASGDFNPLQIWAAGLAGAILGDQTGYHAARHWLGGPQALSSRPSWQKALEKAQAFQQKWGGISVFLTRWLLSPLGPWVNLSAGFTGFSRASFTAWSVAGETIWISLYVGLGFFLSDQAQAIADIIGNAVWLVAALAVTIWLGMKLFRRNAAES